MTCSIPFAILGPLLAILALVLSTPQETLLYPPSISSPPQRPSPHSPPASYTPPRTPPPSQRHSPVSLSHPRPPPTPQRQNMDQPSLASHSCWCIPFHDFALRVHFIFISFRCFLRIIVAVLGVEFIRGEFAFSCGFILV